MPAAFGVEQAEDRALLGVVGLRRVAGRGSDALVLLADQRVVVERLVRRVAPQLAPHASVEPLGDRLGQPVGKRCEQDGRVVVVLLRETASSPRRAAAGGDREGTDVVARRPIRRGAVKSDRAMFGRPSGLAICWRRVCSRSSSADRESSVNRTMSSSWRRAGRPEADRRVRREQSARRRPARASSGRRRTARVRPRPRFSSVRISG